MVDINEGNWLQVLFYFIVLMGIVTAVIGIRFFCSSVACLRLKFSPIALWRKGLQLDSKSDLTTNGLILGSFCWKMASFVDIISVWTEFCKRCSIVILVWQSQFFSVFRLRGILVCSSKMLLLLSQRILYYGLISFRNAMQPYFLSFCVLQPFFLGGSGKTLWLLPKTK